MRLTDTERRIIKQTVQPFDQSARVILFGSRANDKARGGDIDLLIISERIASDDLNAIRWRLWEQLGEQKIDLVLSRDEIDEAFAQTAFEQGVEL
jgi:predicted nucleotidyltransferase